MWGKELLVILGLLLYSCDPQTRYEVLSVFFEGVPMPGGPARDDKKGQLEKEVKTKDTRDDLLVGSKHKPYVEGQCKLCHPSDNPMYVFTKADLCNTCHAQQGKHPMRESAVVVRENVWLHDPVAKKLCSQCHTGHESKYRFLVRQMPAAYMCLECHKGMTEQFSGQTMDCTACHDPHYTAQKEQKFLKALPPDLCAECHRTPDDSYWLHGPYALGLCSKCHVYHGSPHLSQLVDSIAQLCQNCHDLKENSYHPDMARTCTDCHDPHYATDQKDYLLKERSKALPMVLRNERYGLKPKESK